MECCSPCFSPFRVIWNVWQFMWPPVGEGCGDHSDPFVLESMDMLPWNWDRTQGVV